MSSWTVNASTPRGLKNAVPYATSVSRGDAAPTFFRSDVESQTAVMPGRADVKHSLNRLASRWSAAMHSSMVGWFVASSDSRPQYRQTIRLFGDGDFVTVPSMKLWTALGQEMARPQRSRPD